jgi:N-acetylglucosaminylphosphatidylinositol deacetylase
VEISGLVDTYIKENKINGIVTFDHKGISGHPNHIACYHGISMLRKNPEHAEVKMYALETVNVLRKFIGVFDAMFSAKSNWSFIHLDCRYNWKAMKAHWSQFVWFRWVFIAFSRYTYINTLTDI